MNEICLIAALDRRGGIGRDNQLPWRLPGDLQRFKSLTMGKTILMGRKTAFSLGRALPGRRNLVLTRSGRVPFSGMETVGSRDEAICRSDGESLMVIGGGEVYAMTLPLAIRMHLTHVDTTVADADVFFPDIDPARWQVQLREAHAPDEKHAFGFEFVDYERR